MKDMRYKQLSTCYVNECVILTNREFLKFAFSENYQYKVAFNNVTNQQEFCEKQKFEINLSTLNENVPSINLTQVIKYEVVPSKIGDKLVYCVLRPSFENI